MTAQIMQIGNRPCRIYGEAHAEYLLLQMTGEHELQSMESAVTAIAQSAHHFLFAAIPVESWNEEFINHIRSMNISMNIPETLDGIRNEDIPKLACYADKEANPLYPVPALWGPEKLEQMYHLVQEVSEHDRNRNSEHPGKAA